MNNEKTIPRMATVKQAAKEFHISCYSVRQLAYSGQINCFKSGKKVLINLSSLEDFLNNSKINN
ncbi:MAG: helix-turn-helix domain-containing protein [Ruminococcus sp.]|jgi:excisionase family DNA binding protein|nr:helix-turn-helix domain-containing protein [Ruminococcus sp.]